MRDSKFIIVLLFLTFFSFGTEAKDRCANSLEKSDSKLQPTKKINRDNSLQARIDGTVLRIEDVSTKKELFQFNLNNFLPNSTHLISYPTEISWSLDNKKLVIVPHQFENQAFFAYFYINLTTNTFTFKKIDFPQNVFTAPEKLGLFKHFVRSIWFPRSEMFAFRVELQTGKYFKKVKEVLLLIDQDQQLQSVMGFNLDEGYKVDSVYQNDKHPSVIDVTFYHKQYWGTSHERWDIESGLPISSKYLYEKFKPDSQFTKLRFEQNSSIVTADQQQYGAAQILRSPNGKFYLHLTIVDSDEDHPGYQQWAIDIVKAIPTPTSEHAPLKWSLQASIPAEINFEDLEIYWHRHAETIIIKANDYQVYLWNEQLSDAEVFIADNFEVHNDILFLYIKENNVIKKTIKYDLNRLEVIEN
ncbi:MAG: hypothetical protein KDD58_07180 [Bdellovibrionales bacterium]|nr:hypothetical protein [Bdellovibrionales bacterium]